MANNNRGRGWWCAVASAAVLAISAAIAPGANGQVTRVERTADKAQLVNLATAPEVAPVARPQQAVRCRRGFLLPAGSSFG